MRGKFFLVLLITILIGIQPVCAQSESDGVVQPVYAQSESEEAVIPAVPKKIVKKVQTVININLASDDEFFEAMEAADDVEMVNEEAEESGAEPNQGK